MSKNEMKIEPLKKEQVIKAIKHNYPSRIPVFVNIWNYNNTSTKHKVDLQNILAKYPCDFSWFMPIMPGYGESSLDKYPDYRWLMCNTEKKLCDGIDSRMLIDDWCKLEDFIKKFPDPNINEIISKGKTFNYTEGNDTYLLAHFPNLFFERLWSFRGMENALIDFYEFPEEVRRIFYALTEFYKVIMRRCKNEMKCDGFYVTDDLGAQSSLIFSPAIFKELLKPFYKQIVEECHRLGMHFWLHSCGNITEIIDDLIDIGVDVIHPIQKHSMDEKLISKEYKGKICFWSGIDMQNILCSGRPDEVRLELRHLIDTFDTTEGGMMIALGNGITEDIPLENIDAFLQEAFEYGTSHRAIWRKFIDYW